MATTAIVGTLDTKEADFGWMKEQLEKLGVDVIMVDTGSFSTSHLADVKSNQVIEAAGFDPVELRSTKDRGAMMAAMGKGASKIVSDLVLAGRVHAVISAGGSGGSSVAAAVLQGLPIGVPKLLVSTMASGDVARYVGAVDTAMMYSVVDVAGLNRVSKKVYANAVAAIAGMAKHYADRVNESDAGDRPLVGISMFGVTTAAARTAADLLTELGYEPLIFHATGTGGQALEKLAADGELAGVLDLTTTELCDELCSGILTAGPDRLKAVGKAGVPQVVSVGALDMVNFGAMDSVPEKYAGRNFVIHNPTITLMRTTAEEMAILGGQIGSRLAESTGPVEIFLPLKGVSALDSPGEPFYDPQADRACFEAIKQTAGRVAVTELDLHINDEDFALAMARRLHQLIQNK